MKKYILSLILGSTLLCSCVEISVAKESWSKYFDGNTTSQWKQEGFTFEEAQEWTYHFNPSLAGLPDFPSTPHAPYDSMPDLTISKAAAWKKAQVDPADARKWVIMGFHGPMEIAPWLEKGFSREQVKEYIAYGFKDPKIVSEWQALKFTTAAMKEWRSELEANEVIEWVQMGFNKAQASACKNNRYTIEDVKVLNQSGLKPEETQRICGNMAKEVRINWETNKFTLKEIPRWSRNFSLEEATGWRDAHFTPDEAYKYKSFGQKNAVKVKQLCPSGVKSVSDLFSANPYDVAGICYEFVGETQQILTRSTALFNQSGRGFYIDFGKASAPAIYFRGVVKGVGVYDYTTTMGAAKKVPHLTSVYQGE